MEKKKKEFLLEINNLKDKIKECTRLRALKKECHELGKYILDNYGEYKPIWGDLLSQFDNRISVYELIDKLEQMDDTYKDIDFSILSRNDNNQERLNFELFRDSFRILNELNSIDFYFSNTNNLIIYNNIYLISIKLKEFLEEGYKLRRKEILSLNKDNSFYMIVFNVLKNKDELTLIYNYRQYNNLFYNCFKNYIMIEQMSTLINLNINICSSYFFLVDEKFSLNINERNLIMNGFGDQCTPFYKIRWLNFIDYLKFRVLGTVNSYNLKDLAELIKLIYSKQYITFIDKLPQYNNEDQNYFSKLDINNPYNLISRFVFIVSDLNTLLNELKSLGFNNINQGPQNDRGKGSYINYILTNIDKDFRESMQRHNVMFYQKDKNNTLIHKNNFSFKNIHINLGNVRWFSMGRKMNVNNPNLFFKDIKDIIMNNPINEETQIKIEEFLFDYNYQLFNKGTSTIYDRLGEMNKELKDILLKSNDSLICIINNYKKRELDIKYKIDNLNQKKFYQYHLSIIFKELPTELIVGIIIWKLLVIMNNTKQIDNNCIKVFNDIGKHFINVYYYNLYRKVKNNNIKNNEEYTMYNWRLENKNLLDIYINEDLISAIGALIVDWLRDLGLIEINLVKSLVDPKQKINVINLSKELEKIISKLKPINLPSRLPMIVKPKLYERILNKNKIVKERLGGYLLNDEKIYLELIIKNSELKFESKIKNINIIYDSVNYISSVGYKINKDVLDFLKIYGFEFGIIKDSYVHPLQEKLNKTKKLYNYEKKELEKFKSIKSLQDKILILADVFENVHEFFIPVRIDNRGRIYCIVDYLNYQGNELAKSLLLFSRGEKILKTDKTSINYLKGYGANCYGNKLEKSSWNDRINWVQENEDNILNYHNGILISKAESKYLFIAFCIEYKRWIDCLKDGNSIYFTTFLPIQLDATCNGLQHLSMLGLDKSLAEQLNLTKSDWKDKPKDLYTFISGSLDGFFNSKLSEKNLTEEDKDSYFRLKSLNIQRKIIKKSIMTIPYNASPISILEYLKEHFKYDHNLTLEKNNVKNSQINEINDFLLSKLDSNILDINRDQKNLKDNNKKLNVWYTYIDDQNIQLCNKDFLNLYKGIKFVFSDLFPSLNLLIQFLKDIAFVCTELNMYIPWVLPTGLQAYQSYMEFKNVRIEPFSYGKETFALKIGVNDKFNKRKQIRAFMPNLIHSLDGATLTMLIRDYFELSNSKNIFAVHDCFAVTANNMDFIISKLKLIYIILYSDIGYLRKLDKEIIRNIKNIYGENCFNRKNLVITYKDKNKNIKNISYPNIKKVLVKSFYLENIKSSVYLIN